MFHGRKDEAGCGRWEPPSWPYPQHDERVWRGETEAEKQKQMVGVSVISPTVYLKHSWRWLIFGFYITYNRKQMIWKVGVEWLVTNRVAGNSERFVAGRCGCCVLDLPAQVFHPVLQVLFVGANHLQTVKHCAWRSRDSRDQSVTCSQTALYHHVLLPFSSKAFLCASQSSSLDTVMPARGNFPCRLDPNREIQFKPKHVYRTLYL